MHHSVHLSRSMENAAGPGSTEELAAVLAQGPMKRELPSEEEPETESQTHPKPAAWVNPTPKPKIVARTFYRTRFASESLQVKSKAPGELLLPAGPKRYPDLVSSAKRPREAEQAAPEEQQEQQGDTSEVQLTATAETENDEVLSPSAFGDAADSQLLALKVFHVSSVEFRLP